MTQRGPERDRLEAEVVAAWAELEAYEQAMARARPWMEGTDRTLGEALAAMREAGIEPGWQVPSKDVRA